MYLRAALLIALATACSPAAQSYCEQTVRENCKFQYQCCNGAERSANFRSEAECVDENLVACGGDAALDDAIADERAELDTVAMDACQADLRSFVAECSFEKVQGWSQSCGALAPFTTGKVAAGDECYESFECKDPGAACITNAPANEGDVLITRKGKCSAPPKIGDACPDDECEPGAFCNNATLCEAVHAIGADCDGDAQCVDTAFCDGIISGSCVEKGDTGADCFFDGECKSDDCDFANGVCRGASGGDNVDFDICTGR